MGQLVINRTWAMPNKRTFSIKPIENVITKYAKGIVIDPFANESAIATITNDIDPHVKTDYHLDALDFLKIFSDGSIDTVLYDPPIRHDKYRNRTENLIKRLICKRHRLRIGLIKKTK